MIRSSLRERPAAMLVDCFVDRCHQANGFCQRRDDALIVSEVVVGKWTTFAVLKPFLANLVTTDMEGPHFRRHTIEVLRLVNPDTTFVCSLIWLGVTHGLDCVVPSDRIAGNQWTMLLYQVQPDQFLADIAKGTEEVRVRRER